MYKNMNINNYNNINNYEKCIILMRHSEATHNKNVNLVVENAIQNNMCPKKAKELELMKKEYINSSLSYEGIQNAKKQISIIQNIIDIHRMVVLSSPLLRTLQTANTFDFKKEKNKIFTLNCLIERRTKRPCDNFSLQSIDYNSKEETNDEVFKRTKLFISKLNNYNKQFIIVITHKRFLIELSKNKNYFENYGNPYFEPGEFRVFVH
jgi:broad specificity phosphatase PhoE